MSEPLNIKPDEPCCEVWPRIVRYFGWMVYSDQADMACMPYLPDGKMQWRVNFCPSCGKEIRNVNIETKLLQPPT